MRLVEKGSGVTFITELALRQMPEKQHQLVRPFAIPVPTREVVIATHKQFVRTTMLGVIQDLIRASVPQDMRQLRSTQLLVR
jgi:LysR family hydrogen peroxide-inducible transcriptional activator